MLAEGSDESFETVFKGDAVNIRVYTNTYIAQIGDYVKLP